MSNGDIPNSPPPPPPPPTPGVGSPEALFNLAFPPDFLDTLGPDLASDLEESFLNSHAMGDVVTVPPGSSAQAIIAEAIICVQKGWTRGAHARDADGNPIDPNSSLAVEYCITGAIECAREKVTWKGKLLIEHGECVVPAIQLATKAPCLATWNDGHRNSQVKVIQALQDSFDTLAVCVARVSATEKATVTNVNDIFPSLPPPLLPPRPNETSSDDLLSLEYSR